MVKPGMSFWTLLEGQERLIDEDVFELMVVRNVLEIYHLEGHRSYSTLNMAMIAPKFAFQPSPPYSFDSAFFSSSLWPQMFPSLMPRSPLRTSIRLVSWSTLLLCCVVLMLL